MTWGNTQQNSMPFATTEIYRVNDLFCRGFVNECVGQGSGQRVDVFRVRLFVVLFRRLRSMQATRGLCCNRRRFGVILNGIMPIQYLRFSVRGPTLANLLARIRTEFTGMEACDRSLKHLGRFPG